MSLLAQGRVRFRTHVRAVGARFLLKRFYRVYWQRTRGARIVVPKATEAAFSEPEIN